MKSSDFFNVVLKIFGLFFLRELINSFALLISSFFYLFNADDFKENLFLFFSTILVFTFYSILTYWIIFKTNRIIRLLKLDKDFNDKIFELKFPKNEVLLIALIVTSGVILIIEIPYLCKSLFLYFQEKKVTMGQSKPNYGHIIISVVKIILASLLVGERAKLISLFTSKDVIKSKEE
jgi:hypothetical protein